MRIAIITIGSRGDVQPFVALGQGLIKAGHTVRLVTQLENKLRGDEIEHASQLGQSLREKYAGKSSGRYNRKYISLKQW